MSGDENNKNEATNEGNGENSGSTAPVTENAKENGDPSKDSKEEMKNPMAENEAATENDKVRSEGFPNRKEDAMAETTKDQFMPEDKAAE
jgi:hypothetical protein